MNHSLRRAMILVLLFASILGMAFPACAEEETESTICSEEELQTIWDYFMELTGNSAGAAAIMGNLYYESHWRSDKLEDTSRISEQYNNQTYTVQVDSGEYKDFSTDRIGYGLAQWTDPGRKAGLLKKAQELKVSISDLNLQLTYIGEELERFHMMYRLSHENSVYFLSDYVLENFENPGLQDEQVKLSRAKMSLAVYNHFTAESDSDGDWEDEEMELTQAQLMVAGIAANSEAYGIPSDSGYCQAWVTAVYRMAGFQVPSSSSAASAADAYGISEDLENIPVGAAIYGHSHSQYGHVGIVVGNRLVCHNVGGVIVESLDNWIETYDGYCWGWPGNYDLTQFSEMEDAA